MTALLILIPVSLGMGLAGLLAFFWALQAEVAYEKLKSGDGVEQPEFYKAKIATAKFYFDQLLPRAQAHATSMTKPSENLTRLPVDSFVFE